MKERTRQTWDKARVENPITACKNGQSGYFGLMDLEFSKMHGLGNDFVILDARVTRTALNEGQRRFVADRRRGVGCDQLITLEPPKNDADIFMRIHNPDGSEAGACGNASRCVADLFMAESGRDRCRVETISNIMECTRTPNGQITVDMGNPRLEWKEIPVLNQCDTLHLPLAGDPVGVSMGNPHCVFFCSNPEDISVDKLGSKIEHDPLFPDRTNVEYVGMLGPDHLRMRVWERGAGITQACGTGACAAAVAAIRRGMTGRHVRVTLDGGDLMIEWRESDGHVLMTGPVAYSFKGVISIPS